jgi:predicted metal-binding membrane protein
MSAAAPGRLGRSGLIILVVLLVLAAAAWVVLIDQAATLGPSMGGTMGAPGPSGDSMGGMSTPDAMAGGSMGGSGSGLTMGMGAALFIGLWALMMVAIMFPTAAPMILVFARLQEQRSKRGRPYVPTWLFAGSYIVVWAATGVVAYLIAVGVDGLAAGSPWLMENGARIGGALIVAAGLYQLTPMKAVCLEKCRSPLGFISASWRDGRIGAIQMGVEHAAYCIGCCWLLFAILFPLGMMNIVAMAGITALILAEKVLPFGERFRYVVAGLLIGYGAVVIMIPSALPTTL